MPDEEIFNSCLNSAKFDVILPSRTLILNPASPGTKVEIDNIAQKGTVLYIFEGSRGPPDVQQIRKRYALVNFNKPFLVALGLNQFATLKLFRYNLKHHRFIEYDAAGNVLNTKSYSDIPALISILSNI